VTARRITIVGSELLGRAGTGGPGAADSLLAIALGQHGHQVELLIASGRDIGVLHPKWTEIYESAGVEIRVLERMTGVRPAYLAPTFEVFEALRENPPEVVIVDDWRALGYAALRARQAARALEDTAFVLYCHGPGRVLTTVAQKVPDTVDRFAEQLAEKASLQLADAVVSPTRWLLDWMREHRWPVPDSARVIQLLRESAVLGATPAPPDGSAPIRRVAFFGPLREGKGIRIFLAGLNKLEREQLDDVELLFLGSESNRWPRERIIGSLPAQARQAARIETQLQREAALEELRRPGTLAVMPSLLDNSPNTVAECVEYGIPFIASATGGIPELVAEADHARVLCRPTADDLATALTRALADSHYGPARPARDPRESIDAWVELVESVEHKPAAATRRATRVAVVASGEESERRARQLAAQTRTVEVDVVRDASRRIGLARTAEEWVLFLDDEDQPDDDLLDVLVAAQAASGADAVTAAVRPAEAGGVHLFLGDPGPLGLVENQYGVLGLVRPSDAVHNLSPEGTQDPDWPLFARLALGGARILSLPEPLSTHVGQPGRVEDVPGDGVVVLESFEERDGAALADLPQLAATLAAAYAREVASRPESSARPPLLQRLAGHLTTLTSRRRRRGLRR
jgi:glycosyltransferase involved in cell wall biosynthesis